MTKKGSGFGEGTQEVKKGFKKVGDSVRKCFDKVSKDAKKAGGDATKAQSGFGNIPGKRTKRPKHKFPKPK